MTGRDLLSKYLETHDLTLRDFAARVGTTASNICQLKGSPGRKPGVDLAFAIEKVTRGAVPAKAWQGEQ